MVTRALNIFQRVMRLWDRVYPYNAAQVLQLRGPMNAQRLGETFSKTLSVLGLGKVRIEGNSFSHERCDGDTAPSLRIVDAGTTLEEFIGNELNDPFDGESAGREPYCPFRPFVVQCEGSYFAGVIYHHWVADSVSIRMLLREWFYRMYEPARARTEALRIPQGGVLALFRSHARSLEPG
jgi:hypothetical protein